MRETCWCGGRVLMQPIDPSRVVCAESTYHDPLSTGRPERITKIYVAGPMSNLPENNYPAFNEASRQLRGAGYTVTNPAEFGVEGKRVHYVDLLREDLRQMLDCHGIATLPNWYDSTGARNEVNVGSLLKMPVLTVAEWMKRALSS